MKLIFGLNTKHGFKNRFVMWLLDKEEKDYRSCKPSRARKLEQRIKHLKKKLIKKL